MFELIKLLDTVLRTISSDLEALFEQMPEGAASNFFRTTASEIVTSPTTFFAFAIVLNHDTQANIEEYIAVAAPSDIKATCTTSERLISYLESPVVFSVSFLIENKSKLLRDYMTDDNIRGALADMRAVVAEMTAMIPHKSEYYRADTSS